jgi:hypothetical protein
MVGERHPPAALHKTTHGTWSHIRACLRMTARMHQKPWDQMEAMNCVAPRVTETSMADRDLAADHFPEPGRRPRPVRRRAADRRHLHDRTGDHTLLALPYVRRCNHSHQQPRSLSTNPKVVDVTICMRSRRDCSKLSFGAHPTISPRMRKSPSESCTRS